MLPILPFQFECIELNQQTPTEYYGRFVFRSLGVGDGKTIGTILRRVLLTNLPGLRIVGVKIAGVNNEFSTIPGVREDVLEILLNLKNIVFKGEKQESQFGKIKVQGPAIVTTSCIELTPDIKIVNPSHYIATISEKVTLEIDMKMDWGKGYTLAENRPIQDPKSYLEIDAVFMPVKNVIFNIETSFSETLGAQEQLILDLWTDGSLTPSDAISLASKTIISWFNVIESSESKSLKLKTMGSEKRNTKKTLSRKDLSYLYWLDYSFPHLGNFERVESSSNIKKLQSKLQTTDASLEKDVKSLSVEELNLSTRAHNALKSANINYIGEILEYSLKDLRKIKNLGQKSVQEVLDSLETRYGIFIE
jgi:DNA-directed RNA polymerase subunit alpha